MVTDELREKVHPIMNVFAVWLLRHCQLELVHHCYAGTPVRHTASNYDWVSDYPSRKFETAPMMNGPGEAVEEADVVER